MKLSTLLYGFFLAHVAMSKNLVDLELLKESLHEENHEKRDGKNVIDLKQFQAASQQNQNSKREAKNVYDLDALKQGLASENEKREAKNVANLASLQEGVKSENDKRSEQYIFNIQEQDIHQNLLQSILPQLQSITIFTGYIRDEPELESKTADSQQSMIIIAPSDNAIRNKLNNLKPWEFPTELKGDSEDDRIVSENLQNFLNGHIIIDFNDKFVASNDAIVASLINGKEVKIKQDGVDKFKIMFQDTWIRVEIVKQVDNGYIFVIDDVLVKP